MNFPKIFIYYKWLKEKMIYNKSMKKQNIISSNSMESRTKNQLIHELFDGINLDDLQKLVA